MALLAVPVRPTVLQLKVALALVVAFAIVATTVKVITLVFPALATVLGIPLQKFVSVWLINI